VLPFHKRLKFRGLFFYKLTKLYFWFWVIRVVLLTWIGSCPVEEPYVLTGQLLSVFYFSYYFIFLWVSRLTDNILT
jgi:ubiquinol-cytochrome c reductase cytochrome b subunit